MKRAVFLILVFSLSIASVTSRAAELLKYPISSDIHWYPYINLHNVEDPERPGILVELMPLILKRAGLEGLAVDLPQKRINNAMNNGSLDFDVSSPSWFSQGRFDKAFIASDAIMPVVEKIVYLPSQQRHFQDIGGIQSQIVGTVRGYHYHDADTFLRFDFKDERAVVQALGKQRVPFAILNELTAKYWSAYDNVSIAFGPIHSQGELAIRLRKEHASLMPAINKAIAELRQEQVIDKLKQKYGL